MIRKKLFILISILTVLFLFGTAAVCNQCSISTDTTEEQETEEQSQAQETGQQRLTDDDGDNGDNGEEPPADDDPGDGDGGDLEGDDGDDDPAEEDHGIPVINLVTADGRDVTNETELNAFVGRSIDFRVEASDPENSGLGYNTWDVEKARIENEEQIDNVYSFVLVPESSGEGFLGVSVFDINYDNDSWSVILSIGSEEGGSGGYVHDDMSFIPDISLSGQIDEDRVVTLASTSSGAPGIYVGDTPSGGNTKGYLSFDVSELNGKNVAEAELVISSFTPIDDPLSLHESELDFFAVNYGSSLDGSDYRTGEYTYLTGMSPDRRSFTISGETFKNAVQEVFDDSGRAYFQVKLFFENSNTDGNADGFVILMDYVRLNITYYPA